MTSTATIEGSTELPPGFAHPHASEEARRIAETGMILRTQVGSGVHGTSISGQDDRDEMGICLEPPQFVTGLARVPNGIGSDGPPVRFEQYERHTVWDEPGGLANRSGAGDLDVIIYSARKWARLALAGNPTVLLVLFVPDEDVVYRNAAGAELVGNARRVRLTAGGQPVPRIPAWAEGRHDRRDRCAHQPARARRDPRLRHEVRDARVTARTAGRRVAVDRTNHLAGAGAGSLVSARDTPRRGLTRRGRRSGAQRRGSSRTLRNSPAVPDQPDRAWVDAWLHRSYLEYWHS